MRPWFVGPLISESLWLATCWLLLVSDLTSLLAFQGVHVGCRASILGDMLGLRQGSTIRKNLTSQA